MSVISVMVAAPIIVLMLLDLSTVRVMTATKLPTSMLGATERAKDLSLNYYYFHQFRNISHCVDINECRINNGGCSQDCINSKGSFYCTCSDQYVLGDDGKTCTGKHVSILFNKI